MEIGAKSPGLTLADIQQAAQDAAAAMVPPFASAIPRPEMTGGSPGSQTAVPRADHQHPRLTATSTGALNGSGVAIITFTRSFSTLPAVTVLEINSAGTAPPADFKVQSFAQNAAGEYTGCTIYGSRSRVLPTLTQVSGALVLLSAVISATNAVFQVLSGYVPYEAAAGAQFSLIALEPTKAA